MKAAVCCCPSPPAYRARSPTARTQRLRPPAALRLYNGLNAWGKHREGAASAQTNFPTAGITRTAERSA